MDISDSVYPKTIRIINVSGMIFIGFYVLYIVGIYKVDLLFRLQELSLFIPDGSFFKEHLTVPGGLLGYIGAFLLQFCYYPWLGAVWFLGLFFLLQSVVYRVTELPSACRLLAFIPSILFLLFVVRLDYRIYLLHDPEIIYSQLIGAVFSVILLGVYKACGKLWSRILCISLVLLAGYPLIGFYSLFAVGLMMIYDMSVASRRNWTVVGIAFLFVLLLPEGYVRLFYERVNLSMAYRMGLPSFDWAGGEQFWYVLLAALLALALLLCLRSVFHLVDVKRMQVKMKKVQAALTFSGIVFVVLSVVSWLCAYKDANFHAQLKMERAMEQEDWEKILDIASATAHPTRILVMYRNIALYRTGRLCDKMFTYPDGSDPMNVPIGLKMTGISAPQIYYYFGRLNFCYRWAMEQLVQQGASVNCLQWLARTAVFNREQELARKYLHLLGRTWFYKGWAAKYDAYLNNAELLAKDSDYKPVYALQQYENTVWEDNSVVESNILNHYAGLEYGTGRMLELSMASVLTTKSVAQFWKKFPIYINQFKGKAIPVHVLEAALLYAGLEKNESLKQHIVSLAGVTSPIVTRFDEFMQLVQMLNGETDEKSLSLFRSKFADTYWFYYFFVNDIKTD